MTFVWEEVSLKTDDPSRLRVLRSGSAAVRLVGLSVRCPSLVSVVCCQVEVSAWG